MNVQEERAAYATKGGEWMEMSHLLAYHPGVVARRSGVSSMAKASILAGGALIISNVAVAADLDVTAPLGCDLEATLREDAERLTGAPIAEVAGTDFEVEVDDAAGWRLRLVTIDRATGTRRLRELRGASCAEVTNAGAVLLALAIQQVSPSEGEAASSAESEPPPPPESLSEVKSEPAPQADRAPAEQRTRAERAPVSLALGAGVVIDSSALPALAPGVGVELSVRYAGFRLGATGTWLAHQHAAVDAERGGDFQLLAAGLLACREAAFAAVTPLACAGYELGSLQGEGTGVTHTKLGAALWQAARLEAGLTARVGSFGLDARGGVAVPFERREFVLEGTDLVHRPGGLSARLYLGVNSTF